MTTAQGGYGKTMSEYVKIKRRIYDELIDIKGKYVVLCEMLEAMEKVYRQTKMDGERKDDERTDENQR